MEKRADIYSVVMTRFRERKVPQRKIAAETGVPFSTVSKIARGANKDPSVHTIQRLYDYFSQLSPVEDEG